MTTNAPTDYDAEVASLFSIRRPERHEVRSHLAESRRAVLAYCRRARTRPSADMRASCRDQAVQEYARYRALKRYLASDRALPDGWYEDCARDGAGA